VEEEIFKERHSRGLGPKGNVTEEAYQRIYGASQAELLTQFWEEKGLPRRRDITFDELKEFTYWCFKYRLKHSDRARLASDTKKALDMLQRLKTSQHPVSEGEAAVEEELYVVQL